ncbi:long-chain-fatty-acid--CoA ligase [Sphingomonas abietis]|uniref:Long-chain fatty acid--CoA ligase n=1 Tax=Sphingomonas abietis TaxID=3012344 RepID=A0ABY7NN78_9SPHN|nr:long-chain fatty acid--CoA ligase [Sphingomonas abietis]WBO22984.1 long-chain fatty acid--CoA ligase [Sphingomonas abietis]
MSDPALASTERPGAADAATTGHKTGNGFGHSPSIPPRRLTDLLDHAVATWPERVAIDFMARRWRYAELGALVDRAARGLQDLGVKPGDRVGLCLPNTPYYVALYFATFRIGGIVVNLNPLYVERELCHLLQDSGCKVIATCDITAIHAKVTRVATQLGLEKLIGCPIAGALPALKSIAYRLFKRREIASIPPDALHITFARLIASGARPDPVTVKPEDVAVLQYTGGTTGEPKAAMLTHANLTANSAQMVAFVGDDLDPAVQERALGVLPLFHVFALTSVLNYSIDTGAMMVLLPRFELKQMVDTVGRTQCTALFAVPTIYGALNNLPDAQFAKLRSAKRSISGGAPLPFDVRHRFEERMGSPLVEGYGLSEASPIITCNPLKGEPKDNSAGAAFPGTLIEIRDLEDLSKLMPQGERGEICARGPQVMKGYWHRPDADAEVFIDGALRTGDVGYLDEDGYLFIVDRMKDLIIAGGYNVYPRTIEEALYEHPAIAEAVVIAVDDRYRGQAPKAFVSLKAGHSVAPLELHDFLKDKLSKIEMPREIEIRDNLPKTLIGKLSKKELVAEEKAKAAMG